MSDDDTTTPEPVFKLGDNFSSAYFGSLPDEATGEKNPSKDRKLINTLITLLVDPAQKELKADALNVLRNAKAQQFLVDLIASDDFAKYRRELIMACWESGLDFSAYLIFFSQLVVNCGYPEAIEAVTVIDEMQELTDNPNLKKALETFSDSSLDTDKQKLVSHIITRLSAIS